MKRQTSKITSPSSKKVRPAMTPEARENQMIALAVDLAEKQLMEGTASSQVITHFLKLGSMKERLEKEHLEEENKLLRAKTKSLEESAKNEKIYADALRAFRGYSGQTVEDMSDDSDVY